jgi:tight adherence protein B
MSLGLITIAVGLIGLGVVVGGLVVSRRASRSLIEERLGITEDQPAGMEIATTRKTPIADALDALLVRRGLGSDLATQLARADLKITVGEFMTTTVILAVSAAAVSYLLRRDMIVTAIAGVAAFFAPRIYVGMLRGRRLKAFNDQLSDTITLLVNSLRAGYSILQAMESVAQEMGEPVSTEVGRVVQEVQLGIPLEEALAHMLRRVPSDDLDMMITAVNVQREVGGNLAEVLDKINYTIRERVRIKGDIQALTAYGRGAGNLLSAVPVVVAVVVYLVNPTFMSLLFTHTCGMIMTGLSVIGIVAGYLVIRKIVNIDV